MEQSNLQRRRLLVALIIGGTAFLLGLAYRIYRQDPFGDLFYPICAAQSLIAGQDPFGKQCLIFYEGTFFPMNPLTTTLVIYPFVRVMPFYLVSALLPGIASGLLAYGITDQGQWWRLLVFASGAYWLCLQWAQWGILIAAVATIPALLPLALVKPQIGLPLLITRATPRRLIVCGVFALVSLAVMPDWPLRYLRQGHLDSYTGFIPLLFLPIGPLLVGTGWLLARNLRSPRLWDLALYSIIPQRSLYDLAVLWTIPRTWGSMALITACSWLPFFASRIAGLLRVGLTEQMLIVPGVYVPLLIGVALEERRAIRAYPPRLQAAPPRP